MKKPAVILLTFLFAMFLLSCEDTTETVDFPAMTNPDTAQFATGYKDYGTGFDMEQDYSNIIAYTEFETYKTDVERIDITVKNNNPGKGFHICTFALLEKKKDGEWTRVNYQPYDMYYETRWALCGIENDTTSQFSIIIAILTEDLHENLTEGEYRAVIFVGAEIVYAPFEAVK